CPYNEYSKVGNGFGFKNYNANELMSITEYALDLYKNKEHWKGIVRQAMESNNSWGKSAQEYNKLYEELLASC
ncbi:starch synthase, partial [Clostridium saudiense]|nr:starch synthase [Clostridium saudiense]